jgi:hypothetical protein
MIQFEYTCYSYAALFGHSVSRWSAVFARTTTVNNTQRRLPMALRFNDGVAEEPSQVIQACPRRHLLHLAAQVGDALGNFVWSAGHVLLPFLFGAFSHCKRTRRLRYLWNLEEPPYLRSHLASQAFRSVVGLPRNAEPA